MGAIHQVPIWQNASLQDAPGKKLAAVMTEGENPRSHDLKETHCFVLGNEGSGLEEATIKSCDAQISIPISGKAESLNVAMATTILLYESHSQC
jgi:TrmH family RNA methyltransferase